MDANSELGQRLQAFARIAPAGSLHLGLDQSYAHQLNYMIQHFDEMGMVEMRDGYAWRSSFPGHDAGAGFQQAAAATDAHAGCPAKSDRS